jgi:hypothetical protein
MSKVSERESLQARLVQTRQLRSLVEDHPLMSGAYAILERDIEHRLTEVAELDAEPRVILYFHGDPVFGSIGIDASFASRVVEPFQNMVMTDYADRFHGVVGKRGRRVGEQQSRLMLTSLPRGSFGLELTKFESTELFEDSQLSETLKHVGQLVASAASSDKDFKLLLDGTDPRVIQNLRGFLEVIAKGHAGLTLETGDFSFEMNPILAREAFERVAQTNSVQSDVEVSGVFKGALLESWRFDFLDSSNRQIKGKLGADLSAEEAAAMIRDYVNLACTGFFEKTVLTFKNGRERESYVLTGLRLNEKLSL